jgi:predicted phosphoribosyltransferase
MEQILFKDRADAAAQLIPKIPLMDPGKMVVLGIPRGGVPIASQIAVALHAPMDVLLIKKLTTPNNPEYAIGAVGLEESWIDEKQLLSEEELDHQIRKAQQLLRERNRIYRNDRPLTQLRGKVVLLVDDGIATGRTLLHAINMVRSNSPQAIWVAVPVSSREAAARIIPKVDRFICLHQPEPFIGVGRFYQLFPPISDREVVSTISPNNR